MFNTRVFVTTAIIILLSVSLLIAVYLNNDQASGIPLSSFSSLFNLQSIVSIVAILSGVSGIILGISAYRKVSLDTIRERKSTICRAFYVVGSKD